jgi:hypothetical protein
MNMLPIRPIAETADSVTLSRADFEALTDLVTDALDLEDIEAIRRRLAAGEIETFPFELAERLLDGDHPVRVFRHHRGLGLRQLAAAAGVSPSYLSEVEAGAKPGSIAFMSRIAVVLDVSIDLLVKSN